MAKGYQSVGLHSNVSKRITKAARTAYMKSADRALNQLAAFRAGKRVMVTISNPNKAETNKPYVRVLASTIWRNPQDSGYSIQ